jgi:hypothetical protein
VSATKPRGGARVSRALAYGHRAAAGKRKRRRRVWHRAAALVVAMEGSRARWRRRPFGENEKMREKRWERWGKLAGRFENPCMVKRRGTALTIYTKDPKTLLPPSQNIKRLRETILANLYN